MNIELRENMEIQVGEKVDVYYNLRKGGFSIKSQDKRNSNKGKVIGYAESVVITDCEFKVMESAYKKIIRTQQKEIYAVVRGYLKDASLSKNENTEGYEEGYINPYTTKHFVNKNDHTQKLENAAEVILSHKHIFYK